MPRPTDRSVVGKRCRWKGETTAGTITGVATGRGGWPVLVVAWDEGAPEWWSDQLSPANVSLEVTDDASEVTSA